MPAKLTRRQLAAAISAPALLAQQPSAPLAATPEAELQAVRDQNRQSSEQLARFPLPMLIEPATRFKA
ncbi:MAG TPA: hypothetical protein VEV17_15945 [Bryobacteraceae bacterium]|nr:hypothetical protein [Bryobacteraceae bacterium]